MTKSYSGKANPHKVKKFSIALPEREGELLNAYARDNGISRPEAIRRMVRQSLRQYKADMAATALGQPANQLNLFDSIQIDIFNNTSKAKE